MRKLVFSLLLASAVATPALAGPGDSNDREKTRAERQQAREERQQSRSDARPAREQRVDRSAGFVRPTPEAPRNNGFVRPDSPAAVARPNIDAYRAQRDAAVQQRQESRQQQVIQRDQALQQRQQQREERQSARPVRQSVPVVSNVPRAGTQPPPPARPRYTPQPQWNTSWHNSQRYDWRNYRNRHRSLFHLGFYYDPFNWGYQRYSIGWRLWPSYFGSSFWINNPWQYQLPYAPPGTRWVRYYNDALLIDMWSGEVVDVAYDFFW